MRTRKKQFVSVAFHSLFCFGEKSSCHRGCMFISQEKETESQSHIVPAACGVLASGVHVVGKCFFKNVRRVGNKLKHTHTH